MLLIVISIVIILAVIAALYFIIKNKNVSHAEVQEIVVTVTEIDKNEKNTSVEEEFRKNTSVEEEFRKNMEDSPIKISSDDFAADEIEDEIF